MSPFRPDLVETWVFRCPQPGRVEYLLIQRSDDRIYPGIWQPVTGGVDGGEFVPLAALREVAEETGLGGDAMEAFYDLDQVGAFYAEDPDAIVTSVMFAVRVQSGAEPTLSHEHVAYEWVGVAEAERRSIWPPYRDSLALIGRLAADPELARWFELDRHGRRLARPAR
ncbi:MAG: NUDIX domain-containing protein [Chloroflexota bacterium]|nr:NUDIX domain-containing protein [Chloroflexota bacterium]